MEENEKGNKFQFAEQLSEIIQWICINKVLAH